MNKPALLRAIITELENDLRRQQAANEDASAGATHGEARAETKWDTCGLESSYLARGHALQFKALVADLETLRTFMIPVFSGKPIGVGALVDVELDKEKMTFFLLPCAGGTEVRVDGVDVTAVTPESPVGAALLDKKTGAKFSFRAGSSGKVLSVS
ncbi:MAG TPA: hypothetical protein PLD51_08645 [Pontiellaceae bacterium]|nr:hypothetical protein [Pontiellaceae bacterium]HPR83911.1 hypothetical protein [Pontiellaceae bacterium]